MIDYRKVLGETGDPAKALGRAMELATATRDRAPTVETGIYAKRGPNARQGVVRIARDPNSPDFQGANRLVFKAGQQQRSFTRIEVDSGVALVYGVPRDGYILNWDGSVKNVAVALGDPSRGRFRFDATGGGTTAARRRFINLGDVQYWLIEDLESRQHLGSKGSIVAGAAVFPFHGKGEASSPRDGIYRRHRNSGSPSGYGPNQIASAWRVSGGDIVTDGGTALRLETDGNAAGVHSLVFRNVKGKNGNRVVACSAHDVNSDNVDVRGITGESMHELIRLTGDPGKFRSTVLLDGYAVAGKTAQNPANGGQVGSDPSRAVISSNAAGHQVWIGDVGYEGFTLKNRGAHKNPTGERGEVYTPAKARPDNWMK